MDLSPDARRVLRLANEARTPSEQDKARIARQLGLAVGVSATALAVGSAHASASVKAAAGVAMWKWVALGSALLSAVLGSYLLAAPHASTASPHGPPMAQGANARGPSLSAAPRPAIDEVVQRAPVREPTRAREPREARKPRAPGSEAAALDAELALLHRAQRAWREGEPLTARALLRAHRRRFGASALALERDALLVLTLCELGERAQAARLARQLLLRAPHAPMRTSIEASCAFE